jgi:hypothetical protein
LLPLAGRANKDWLVLARVVLACAITMLAEKSDLHEWFSIGLPKKEKGRRWIRSNLTAASGETTAAAILFCFFILS